MANLPTLKIKKVVRVDHVKWCNAVMVISFLMMIGQCTVVKKYHSDARRMYGDVTKKLLHDVGQAYKSQRPCLSSYLEHSRFIQETLFYKNPISDDLNNLEIYLILFAWKPYLVICLRLIYEFSMRDNVEAQIAEFKTDIEKYLLYFLICIAYTLLIIFAMNGGINILHQLTLDHIIEWLNKSYVSITSKDTGMSLNWRRKLHPLTQGLTNPFFLQEVFRFVGEDVQFVCEYRVEGAKNVEPLFASSWWINNGVPMKTDDRQLINVTVKAVDDNVDILPELQRFIIRNTLTISMVERQHFGRYACVYHDPMPKKIIISPMFEDGELCDRNVSSAPKTDHSDCGCDSTKNTHNFTKDYIRACFAQFELKENVPIRSHIHVDITLGGILNEQFTYFTFADPSDVSVDVTFLDSTSTKCCSLVTKLYWIFFNGGDFVDLPASRIVWSDSLTDGLNVGKWICVCKDIPRIHNNTIYRTIYNTTLKSWENVPIQHPVSLVVKPLRDDIPTFLESLQFCNKTSSLYTLCGLLDWILENQAYTVYVFDIFIVFLQLFLLVLLKFLKDWSKFHVLIPLRKACICSFATLPIQFEAVNGPQLKLLRNKVKIKGNRGDHNEVKNDPVYDIFLSYCHEDAYDRAVAQHFKTIAIDIGLTVFDPHIDILAGQAILKATSAAIHRSSRFVIFASDAYKQEDFNIMVFDAINDTIKSQKTIAKSRLLVFKFGKCDIDGLHRVPCISIPGSARGTYSLDESCQIRFKEWERTTRPDSTKVPAPYKLWKWLCQPIEKLIKRRSILQESPLYYMSIEETFDVVKSAHISTGYGGRDDDLCPQRPLNTDDVNSGEIRLRSAMIPQSLHLDKASQDATVLVLKSEAQNYVNTLKPTFSVIQAVTTASIVVTSD
ncbi:hypothetical protein PoB_002875300 [Plakobranchus ocellatus]|uniref:TIR domain-containing protein n=1 Tax=Plakobranchus ocellatus TaxID=259542 RepID=A0AAV4A6I1_9GAST|nr:hypothetical protein PoB_002875300 [Plakobranchus ocellatus]